MPGENPVEVPIEHPLDRGTHSAPVTDARRAKREWWMKPSAQPWPVCPQPRQQRRLLADVEAHIACNQRATRVVEKLDLSQSPDAVEGGLVEILAPAKLRLALQGAVNARKASLTAGPKRPRKFIDAGEGPG
jgi:hypothetical protein